MRRTIAGIGRALITLGLLILLFVGYQLWGTGIVTARAQNSLEKDFAKVQQQYSGATPTTPSTEKPQTTTSTIPKKAVAPPIPPEGDVGGFISIKSVGIDYWWVEGVSRDDLKKGPGHYDTTVMPGTLGNAAIAGHRTTYLAPFNRLDEIKIGDEITVSTVVGLFTYKVFGQGPNKDQPNLIVKPNDTWVVAPTLDAQLTLTACHPKYSAEQRIVVKAKLVANKSPKPAKAKAPAPKNGDDISTEDTLTEGLSGQDRSLGPAGEWGIVVLIVGGLWWFFFRRWRHPLVWVLGVIPFLVVLFPFYMFLEQALPSGY